MPNISFIFFITLFAQISSFMMQSPFRCRSHNLRGIDNLYVNCIRHSAGRLHSSRTNEEGKPFEKIVYLKQGKARLFQGGNPIVYGGAINDVRGSPSAADLVFVKDHHGNPVGKGFFNPLSQYRVRMIALVSDEIYEQSYDNIIENRVRNAVIMRKSLCLPSEGSSISLMFHIFILLY